MYIHKAIFNAAYKQAGSLRVTDIRIGLGYTAVEVDHKLLGLSYSFIKEITPASCNVLVEAGCLIGKKASELLKGIFSYNLTEASLAIATANAILNKQTDNTDILDLIEKNDKVVMIGYFGPLIPLIKQNTDNLTICERDTKKDVMPDYAAYFELPDADVALISATTLINKTIDGLLNRIKKAKIVAIIGPSCTMEKSVFKDTPVTHLCGITVSHIEKAKIIVSEGGGTVSLKQATRKECLCLS